MKQLLLFLSFFGASHLLFAQQTINGSVMHDNLLREFIIYIPANYTGNAAVPLVFNFHGYTSNASEQMWYGDFRPIADTAGFIIVHPEGTLLNGVTHFNVGGWTTGSTADDVGFTEAMIGYMDGQYNIDLSRVYSTGMSNGGFMSHLLACQLSNKIAAVASVTGSMTPYIYDNCDPHHPTPALQIHGTSDPVVPYNGQFGMTPVEDVVQYWVDHNNCGLTPTITDLPNTNTTDGSTVQHIVYSGGDKNANTEHFKIAGGMHTWPGTFFVSPGTNLDFNASLEIWKFFSRYNLNELTGTTDVLEQSESDLMVFPNPTNSFIRIENTFSQTPEFELLTIFGQKVATGKIDSPNKEIDLTELPNGTYFLKIENRSFKVVKTD